MRVAALDLGSNTSLLLIADMDGAQMARVLCDETTITRMGQGVHANRRFHPDALARLDECLGRYAEKIRSYGCQKVLAVATSAARDVTNSSELLALGRAHGIPIHIITGENEAALTFRGALCDRRSVEGVAVIDVGGGSTEVISIHAGQPHGTSVDVGSVRLTELFISGHPVSAEEVARMREYAGNAFASAASHLPVSGVNEVVAVAGTATTLAALDQRRDFDEELVHGYRLTLAAIERWTGVLAGMGVEERERLPGMQPKRADVIVAGAVTLAAAVIALGKSQVTVSTRGVRYGVALAWQSL